MQSVRPQALIIDDDAAMNQIVGAYARLSGFDYVSAVTGLAGLEAAQRVVPAVVLLDIMLPDVDGFEICRRLRGDHRTRDVPVIVLTALHDDESRRRGKEAGADEYITKPFEPDRLIGSMKRYARSRP